MSYRAAYPLDLGRVLFGIPFEMLNYSGKYIRVRSRGDEEFNDDGFHVPIVELRTGYCIRMSKIKPVRYVDEPVLDFTEECCD